MSFVSTLRRVYQHPRLEHQILYSLAKRDYHAPRTAAEKSVLKDDPKPGEDLTGFVGKHFIYTYANGWMYEWYCRNHNTCDYRIHRGKVGGRWVTKQKIYATKFKENIFKVDWHEPTGTCVSLLFDLQEASKEKIHGTIFFPQWIGGTDQHPEKTILYQNEFIDQMKKFRDEGPAYPYVIIPEFATICTIEDRGVDNDDVIKEAPGQMEKEPVFDQPQGDK